MLRDNKSFLSSITAKSGNSSVREQPAKDEYHIVEIEKEINNCEQTCRTMCADLEHSPLTSRYVAEINRIWDLLNKSHNNSKKLVDIIKDQILTIANTNVKLTVASEASKGEQKNIDKLTQEVQRALRMVDTAHTREQVAQETIENLRQQINRLHSELEAKSRHTDQEGDFSAMAKTKEAQAKERERMVNEILSLRERLSAALSYQEELERKNSSADLRISELQQELENQINEMSKESRFKERFEDEVHRARKELGAKENQIAILNEQTLELQVKVMQFQNTVKEMKAVSDKQVQTIENLNQRLIKAQDEYQREVGVVEDLKQMITVLNNQIKTNEEEIAKLVSEVAKTSTIQESFKKKLNKMEGKRNILEEQKAKVLMELQMVQRSLKEEKLRGNQDRRMLENVARERDIINKSLIKANSLVSEKERVAKLTDQAKLYLEHEIDNNNAEINRQVQHITSLEKEKDRHVADAVILTKKLEAAIEDNKLQQMALNDYRKKLTETEAKLSMKVAECENVRYELNTCCKNLNEAQEDITEYKHKAKVMTLQIEQLKEDIAGKEVQLMREQLALRKAHAEKEAMRVETMKVEHDLKEAKQQLTKLEADLISQLHIIREADAQRERDQKEIEQLTNARDIINAQLVRRNDELAMLREKTKTLQSSLDAGENHYSQRLEDIRILKLEIQKLSTEKDVLTRNLTNMADLRTEIHHLEKDMSKERLKARALEEELQNPLNIHRWRKLEGSDPSKYELLHKVKVQQRRILDQATALVEVEQKCVDLERRHAHLDQMLARYQHQQPERERAESCKQRLTQSEKKVKYLLGDLQMRMDQVNELKMELEKTNNEILSWKEKFYEQKKLIEKLKGKPVDKTISCIKPSKSANALEEKGKEELPPLPLKTRFMGGGFNISNSSI
ncbi:hypothetical protein J6590_063410 [Homalodisca vitripennis]|nr:hypothetical protein J6590_063410 [Homalodisca vitripennis]